MAFIDKINPDVPEGRLLIRNGEFILKDPDAEVSKIPLDKKWDKLLKYIKDQMYSDSEVDMMICAYGHIYIRRARRDIDKYNQIRREFPKLNYQLRSLLLYDYYDLLPSNRKIADSAYYELNDNFRLLLDDCMRAAKAAHVRDLTISVEASSCANFFAYLQKRHSSSNIEKLRECALSNVFNVSKFLGHKSVSTTMKYIGITPKMTEKAIAQIESSSLHHISAKWKRTASLVDLIK